MFTWSRTTVKTQETAAPVMAEAAVAPEISSPRERLSPMPALRPKLPSATQLNEYSVQVDQQKIYADGGPLCRKLEGELTRHLGCAADSLVATANASTGLTAALKALDLPAGSLCILPAWTSAATPQAAAAAGVKPYFLDIDLRTWALNPQAVKQVLAQKAIEARALIVVSPFGAPIDVTAWQNFQQETGIPAIVDAAAGFDSVSGSSLTSVVSLNANKIFSGGAGGFVVTPHSEMCDRVRGTGPARLDEYHAAIALANLDQWPATRLKHLQIAGWYRQAFAGMAHVVMQPSYGAGWVGGTTNILLESDSAESLSRFMLREGVETKLWWGAGCHREAAFAECAKGDLSKTEYLGARVLGLPHFVDMERADVMQVVSTLSKALTSRARGRRRPN